MILPLLAMVVVAVAMAQNPTGDVVDVIMTVSVPSDVPVLEKRLEAFSELEGKHRGRFTATATADGLRGRFKFSGSTPKGFEDRLSALLATRGALEFWACATEPTDWLLAAAKQRWAARTGEQDDVLVNFGGAIPDSATLRGALRPPKLTEIIAAGWTDSEHRLVAVVAPAALTRADVATATLKEDPMSGESVVALALTDRGRAEFGRITSRCVNRLLPITFDGRAVMVPVVREPITGGVAHINLGPSNAEVTPREAQSVAAAAIVGGSLTGSVTLGVSPTER